MKFHQLRICAFGPFAGTETVDFDALSADGLFLLRGPTGAGKTSVLDALTFALYGNVPGERSADRLKSQHAPAERVPYVELEFSSGQDRYWIRRQPSYYRPAKRAGAKPQREGTSLVLKRFDDGQWQPVPTARVAEGELELEQIIGLKMAEFTKVILLPQGAFAQLLHATNEQRRGILERLFDIGTYERLEAHLWEDMRQAEAMLKDTESRIQAHASSVRSAAESLLGDQHAPAAETDVDELTATITARAQAQQDQLESAEQAARAAMEDAVTAAENLRQARTQLTRWAEHRDRDAELQAQRPGVEQSRAHVAEHRAAATLAEWFNAADQAAQAAKTSQQQARAEADAAQQALQNQQDIPAATFTAQDEVDTEAVDRALRQLLELQARLNDDDAAQLEDRHSRLRSETTAAEQAAAEAAARAEALHQQEISQQQLLQEKRSGLIDPAQLQTSRDRRHHEAEEARRRIELITQRDAERARIQQLEQKRTQDHQHLEGRQRGYRNAAEAYLRSQAHELAATLQPGEPCLVCGSADHPDPLVSAEETVTRAQVDDAAESRDQAQAAAERSKADHTAAVRSLDEVVDALGDHHQTTADEAETLHRDAQSQLDAAEAAQAEQHQLRESIDTLAAALAQTSQQLSAAAQQAEQHTSEVTRLAAEIRDLDHRVEVLRAGYPSIAERRAALSELETMLSTAQRAGQRAHTAAAAAARSASAAQDQLEKSIFSIAEDMEAALCTDEALAQLQRQVSEFDTAAQQLAFDADSEDVKAGAGRAGSGESTPSQQDVEQAEHTAKAAQQDHQTQRERLTAFTARFASLTEAASGLQEALLQRRTQSHDVMRRADLARTVNGQGENTLRMRLTTFVLAARLERIAEAATAHLKAMTGGRYELLLDAERGGRGLRGLDLKVHDEYAEQQRPAETLSGGETFMTSLAMALGLAEVVQAEAGGIDMQSLFIDEGFGSLDEHTLDAVMAALETLQGQGRRIGVVSHVSDMHDQIPVQLRVEKTRTGSQLTMQVPV